MAMTRPSDITRERILKAAQSLFANHGYKDTSVRAVITKARVSGARDRTSPHLGMFAYHHRALSQGQPFVRVLCDGNIEGGLRNDDARRCGNCHTKVVPAVSVPEFNPECVCKFDLMEIGIGKLAQRLVDAKIQFSVLMSVGEGRRAAAQAAQACRFDRLLPARHP